MRNAIATIAIAASVLLADLACNNTASPVTDEAIVAATLRNSILQIKTARGQAQTRHVCQTAWNILDDRHTDGIADEQNRNNVANYIGTTEVAVFLDLCHINHGPQQPAWFGEYHPQYLQVDTLIADYEILLHHLGYPLTATPFPLTPTP